MQQLPHLPPPHPTHPPAQQLSPAPRAVLLCAARPTFLPQLFVELGLPSSVALLSPTGSLLSWRAAESSRAAASPAFLPGGVLMPALLDYMVCQVRHCAGGWLAGCCRSSAEQHWHVPPASVQQLNLSVQLGVLRRWHVHFNTGCSC